MRAKAKRLSGDILFAEGKSTEAAGVLAAASRALVPNTSAARDAILDALRAGIGRAGPDTRRRERGAVSALRRRICTGGQRLAGGWVRGPVHGRLRGGRRAVRAAIAALLADDLDPVTRFRCFELGASAASSLWDDQAFHDIGERWVQSARTQGAFASLPVALGFLAVSDWLAGHFDDATSAWPR